MPSVKHRDTGADEVSNRDKIPRTSHRAIGTTTLPSAGSAEAEGAARTPRETVLHGEWPGEKAREPETAAEERAGTN